jgi:hypothetical protein
MSDTGCPIIGNDGVYGQVTTVMANMWGNSQTAFAVSINALDELGSFSLSPIVVAAHFDPDTEWWHVERPVAPEAPDLVFSPDLSLVPAPPAVDIGGDPSFQGAPTFNETAPVVPDRTGPGPLTATPPDPPPTLDTIVVPEPPDLVIPDFPELRAIVLPDPPSVVLPTFAGVRPNFAIAVPENTFGFEAEPYSSALVDKIKAKVSVMIDGAPGLPAAAAQQMRDRAYSALDVQGLRAEQEAIEVFGSRGWSQPDGVLNRALAEARQNNQNERNKLARDIYLKDVDVAIEDLRFGVAQGAALEGQLMQNFLGVQQLMLDAAKTSIQVAIDIANAQIAIANLELQAFQTDAQVYRDLIQGELAKVEVYRAELEGKKLIGELNAQDVAVFSERVKALLAQADIYKAEVDGAQAKAQVNIARVQAFGEQVKAYDTRVHAYETEWDAFSKQLEADLTRYRRYELGVQVFGNRVKIWGDTNTNLIEQHRLRISDKELDLDAYKAMLERINSAVSAESQRFDALVRKYSADTDQYRAKAAVEQIISEGNARPFQLYVEQEGRRVDTELKNAELRITQALKQAELLMGAKQAIGSIGATLAAGLASSMSVHAGISSSLGQSSSCSTSFDYRIAE